MISLNFSVLLAALNIAATESGAAEQLGAYDLAYPFPSPDGQSLAFQGNFDGHWQLYAMALSDQKMRRLHVSEADDIQPAYSPDGRFIAFTSNRTGNDDIHVLDLTSGDARAVAPHPGKDGHPKWSADGKWIVFNRTLDPADVGGAGDAAIFRVHPDGSGLELISDTSNIETFASLSPDGRRVAFVEWHADARGRPARNGEIIVLDISTGARRNITGSDAFDGYPYWGPSGDWIYYSSVVTGPSGPEMVAYRVGPDGAHREQLTPIDGVTEVRAVPSPDERTLYFNISDADRTLLHRLHIAPILK